MEATMVNSKREPGGCALILVMLAVVAAGVLLASLAAPGALVNAVPADPKIMILGQVFLRREVIVDDYSHGPTDHPADMPAVRKCLGDDNTFKVDFRTSDKGRYLRVCWDGKRTIIFQVIDEIGDLLKERTAYIRNGIFNPTDVVHYIQRVGYFRISGGLQ